MCPVSLQELAWLHDCNLISVLYDPSNPAARVIKIAIQCPTDLGHAPWEGRKLVIVAIDVALSIYTLWGVGGDEMVDAIRPGISPSLEQAMVEPKQLGARFPELAFGISFISGSLLEIVCRELEVEVEGR